MAAKDMKMQLWDITGQPKFRSLTNMYFRDTDAAILVFDLTNKASFESLKKTWIKSLQDQAPQDVVVAIVGNKSDLMEKEEVSVQEVKDFALRCKTDYFLVSAKNNNGLNELF
mmetsp:Transcript_118526/g.165179  ORF Transcript_118526/g.165179 Transcript_118526/m.165179 type:complete len:113 (+) Transcript_118526:178-516(+)|eukprot:CAMPEP_0176366146 /NCGR_PEP_ID=MMETSP0126-20121128/20974_1 /TAXON_ID=141414 ORGANISM="Strombidinopsis acuminatum, Strain SPMC142" /NCGR_SAMPLE_ID=MMETSP0126 /ASSEMBLY_ACC=CAM_ASM_000229 /LENGTH=112 /DNA_ID=CAMNT_0017723447 /DNA_START=167 /DNA_END=505 /DNA_ORIENTATION=+